MGSVGYYGTRFRTAFAVAAICSGAPVAVTGAQPAGVEPPVREWHFTALLDGKPIGTHDFRVARRGDEIDVETHARFRVKALFISVYHYEHDDHEVWRDGCLKQVAATTNDNGKHLEIHGTRSALAFEMRSIGRTAELPPCVKSFAYWDRAFLAEHRLLNAQTGDYEPVTVSRLGTDNLHHQEHVIAAERYHLVSAKFQIDLWYSAAGGWLALESTMPGGRKLRYELR